MCALLITYMTFLCSLIRGKIKSDGGKDTILFAEATSCQLEFKYLAKITGRKVFYQRVSIRFYLDINY